MRGKSKKARRRATNLSIREDVLAGAKRFNINASQVAERALEQEVAAREQSTWLRENARAIESYNGRIEQEGTANEGLRRF